MSNLSVEVNRINFFQRVRLGFVNRRMSKNGMTYDSYMKLPEYIRNHPDIVAQLDKCFTNEDLRKLDPTIIVHRKQDDIEFLNTYSDTELSNFFKTGLIEPSKNLKSIYERLILGGHYDLLEIEHRNLDRGIHSFEEELISKQEEAIPHIINHSPIGSSFFRLLSERPQYICQLEHSRQLQFFRDKEKMIGNSLIRYFSYDVQQSLISARKFLFQYLDIETKKRFIKENPKLFKEIDSSSKIELAGEDIRLFEFLTVKDKTELKKNIGSTDKDYYNLFAKLLKQDVNNIKYFNSQLLPGKQNLYRFFDELDIADEEILKKYVLYSKMMNASDKFQHLTFHSSPARLSSRCSYIS